MRYTKVKVTRSPMSSTVTDIRPWELKIMKLVHDPSNVEVIMDFDSGGPEDTDAATEYARLVDRYGKNADAGFVPFATLAYGPDPSVLEKVIAECLAASKTDPLVA